jgi:nitric oxide reductase activation protein
MESNDKGEYVIDLMIDSSHSQILKQSKLAIQAYILVRAIVEAGIPCRVNGFNSYIDYTILKRYRDYYDDFKQTENIFEYACEGCNRDGLAIKSVCDSLCTREEEKKILIVLSDGKPNDIHLPTRSSSKKFHGVVSSSGGIGINDTTKEVRFTRQKGILVLDVFTGNEKDLKSEKLIYGKDLIFTRDINHFGDIIAAYLKRIISS